MQAEASWKPTQDGWKHPGGTVTRGVNLSLPECPMPDRWVVRLTFPPLLGFRDGPVFLEASAAKLELERQWALHLAHGEDRRLALDARNAAIELSKRVHTAVTKLNDLVRMQDEAEKVLHGMILQGQMDPDVMGSLWRKQAADCAAALLGWENLPRPR